MAVLTGKLSYMPPSKNTTPSISTGLTKKGKVMDARTAFARLPCLKAISLLESISAATQRKGIIRLSKLLPETADAPEKYSINP